jgi:glucosamine--fructose-6-phosphate aminotransferase (isomerizing)
MTQEIAGTAAAVSQLGAPTNRWNKGDRLRFIGCGSSYFLGLTLAATLRAHGFDAAAHPAAEVLLHPPQGPWRDARVIAISRSGTTSETVAALKHVREQGADTFAVTVAESSPLAGAAHSHVALTAATETSVVQTRSVIAAGSWLLASLLGEDANLAGWARELAGHVDASIAFADTLPRDPERVFLLGSGPLWGVAQEGALKLKESALIEAEGFEAFEFRHGPRSRLDAHTLVIGLLQPRTESLERRILEESRALGAQTVSLAPDGVAPEGLSFRYARGVPGAFAGLAAMTVLQAYALNVAQARGLNPDAPRHLSFAVEVDLT